MRARPIGWLLSCLALLTVLVCVLVLGGGTGFAAAENLFVKLERVEVEPYFGSLAKVRLYVSPMTLEGGIIENIRPHELVLEVNGVQRKDRPGVLPFEYTDAPLDLVIVLQTSQRFAAALDDLEEPLTALLRNLPRPARASVVTYGDSLRAPALADPSRAIRALANVVPEDDPAPPKLAAAVERAVKLLKQAAPLPGANRPRRMILVIGDGSNEDNEWNDPDNQRRFNVLGRAAAAEGIVIGAIAYSANDHRDPYRNLGQLAKRTAGTFRWAHDRASFRPQLEDFAREVHRESVLTFFLPPDLVVDAKLRVVCKSGACGESPLASNDKKGPLPACGGATCNLGEACVASQCLFAPITSGGSHLGTGLALGALVVVGAGAGTVFVRRRKSRRDRGHEGPAVQAPGQQAPAQQVPVPQVAFPDFSNMPYLSGSAQAQQLAAMAAQMRGAAPVPQPGPPLRAGVLLVLHGLRQGQTLPLRHGFTIGKTPGCDLLVDDGYTSGYHAQFHLDAAGGCTVVDMGSMNGTYVNGVRSARQKLSHGMVVRVGQTEVRYLQG